MINSINFFSEGTPFILTKKEFYKSWVALICSDYGFKIGFINYIFCSSNYLLHLNKTYKKATYHTDILAFSHNRNAPTIEADIYISIPRIEENAIIYNVGKDEELRRVMAHGILHLLNFSDEDEEKKTAMREAEDRALKLFTKVSRGTFN